MIPLVKDSLGNFRLPCYPLSSILEARSEEHGKKRWNHMDNLLVRHVWSLRRPLLSAILGLASVFIVVTIVVGASPRDRDRARISVLIATGMPGGTARHVGLAMASLWTTKLRETGIRVSAADSEGSRENIEAIRIADADMILVEEFFCSMAFHGTGIYKGHAVPELRSITALWPEATHFLVRADKIESGTIQDLQGLTLATGLPDSGNRFYTMMMLNALKPAKRVVRLRSMSNMAAAEAIRRGTVEAMDSSGGVPMPLLTSLLGEGRPPLRFLDITDQQLEALRAAGWEHAFRYVIPPGTYPGQEKQVNTAAHTSMLAVTATLNSEVVYALTRTLYENLDYLARVHPACRTISLEKACNGLTVPLHRGAARYYRERNVEIPAHLIR
jgi:TRAP transporter TAXI family solute receptor